MKSADMSPSYSKGKDMEIEESYLFKWPCSEDILGAEAAEKIYYENVSSNIKEYL